MRSKYFISAALVALMASAAAAEPLRIVGSSTVFPFSTSVAEKVGRSTGETPIVESTGSGGGFKLFCQGLGDPAITNASRHIKETEVETCKGNGVDFTEYMIGYDGIVLAGSIDGPAFDVTIDQLRTALSDTSVKMWSDIDPSLPMVKIEVLGPPPSSGTRDAFQELVMGEVEIREDGVWIDAGENDNLIVSKLTVNENALGVFGFSFLEANRDKLQGHDIDGVEATYENIESGDYPLARSLYFYVKDSASDEAADYVEEFLSDAAIGEDGYLIDFGLITTEPVVTKY